jgi:type IV pilus assembly protein PilE
MATMENSGMKTPASIRGFTLIELMIVVAVLGILAAIAFPSYRESVRKSRRASATADMGELAQNLERWHTVNNTYLTYAIPARLTRSPQQGAAFYTLAVARTANTFTVTATPTGQQVGDKCGNFTLNQAGTKAVSLLTVAECW